jgi:hypothetical protein
MALRWRARRRRLTAERVEGGLRGFGAVRYTLCSCDFLRVVFWKRDGGRGVGCVPRYQIPLL